MDDNGMKKLNTGWQTLNLLDEMIRSDTGIDDAAAQQTMDALLSRVQGGRTYLRGYVQEPELPESREKAEAESETAGRGESAHRPERRRAARRSAAQYADIFDRAIEEAHQKEQREEVRKEPEERNTYDEPKAEAEPMPQEMEAVIEKGGNRRYGWMIILIVLLVLAAGTAGFVVFRKKTVNDTKTLEPVSVPTAEMTSTPTAVPTSRPTAVPTSTPTAVPTSTPTAVPTSTPTAVPTSTPTVEPTSTPTPEPTSTPTAEPTSTPTPEPTSTPTAVPTGTPTPEPTSTPTPEPTSTPTAEPTSTPTAVPTSTPTAEPTSTPTLEPTSTPTVEPTSTPTAEPTSTPPAGDPYIVKGFDKFVLYIDIEDGRIASISAPEHHEVYGANLLSRKALDMLEGQDIASAKVDIIAGVTMTCNAVNSALEQAAMINGWERIADPTAVPTAEPTPVPTAVPTAEPTPVPTAVPTAEPTPVPTAVPTPEPDLDSIEYYMENYQLPHTEEAFFEKSQRLAVYTGPSRSYFRANNGKAEVSTKGEVQCFGSDDDGDYYMIRYELNNGNWRIGYVRRKDISGDCYIRKAPVPRADVEVVFTSNAVLTDDPGGSNSKLCSIPKGTRCMLVFFKGDYACVDLENSDVGRVRGFVKCTALEIVP